MAIRPRVGHFYVYEPTYLDRFTFSSRSILRGREISPGSVVVATKAGRYPKGVDPLGKFVWIMDKDGNEQSVFKESLEPLKGTPIPPELERTFSEFVQEIERKTGREFKMGLGGAYKQEASDMSSRKRYSELGDIRKHKDEYYWDGVTEGRTAARDTDWESGEMFQRYMDDAVEEVASNILDNYRQYAGTIYYDEGVTDDQLDSWESGFYVGFSTYVKDELLRQGIIEA